VRAWLESLRPDEIYFSVLVVGEIRKGIEQMRRHNRHRAQAIEVWLDRMLALHGSRVIPVDRATAEAWGRLEAIHPVPAIDGLIAATALIHGLTLATRNIKDVVRTGVTCVNPFE
jgi:predicted nucleic acid-binding protein